MEVKEQLKTANEVGESRFNRKAAAKYCGVSIITIDRALAKKRISCFRIGRRVVFDRTHLDDFLKRHEAIAK
jgi:excisionase family DNA binding protein